MKKKKKSLKPFKQINDFFNVYLRKTVEWSKENGLEGTKTRNSKKNRRLTVVQERNECSLNSGADSGDGKVFKMKNIYVISVGHGD